jgi:NAD(P)-dependent dehydrogenase (short-subunit alcohol dehydrogenase family)
MVSRVLVIGGYGNFGSYIVRALAREPDIRLLIAGRSPAKAGTFITGLAAAHPPEAHALDIHADPGPALAAAAPDIVIHTVGPFQGQDYRVAEACIAAHAHYLDLADARAFVAGIGALDQQAKQAGVAIVAGASSVPCLSAAIIDHYRPRFARLDAVDYGISAAQQTNRGLATASAVLSYIGRPFTTLKDGLWVTVHGWQDLHAETYPELGRRLFGNCDVPDLDLFPARYPGLNSVRFGAGHEIALLHLGTWALGGLVRARLLPPLDRFAERLLSASARFDRFGTGRSGLHMFLTGADAAGREKRIRFFLIARSGDGPNIPCMPAILLARRLARGGTIPPGARPCLDLIDLDEYLAALAGLDVSVIVEEDDHG